MTDEFRAKMLERALESALGELQVYVSMIEHDEILKTLHPEAEKVYESCKTHLELFGRK